MNEMVQDKADASPTRTSYCRQCGGDRYHNIVHDEYRPWQDEDTPVQGGDTWSILECCGCHTITFEHSHWFSEDYEYGDDGPEPITYHDLYPSAPARKRPEWWGTTYFLLDFSKEDYWVVTLYKDIYEVIGLKSYALAAMGIRTIVDYVVTSQAKLDGNASFKAKLENMAKHNLISDQRAKAIDAAFDAGSAAVHRGHRPSQEDVFTLLDIAEDLIDKFYIAPSREREQIEKAEKLKMRTPQRTKKNPTVDG